MLLKTAQEMPEITNQYVERFEEVFNTKVNTLVVVGLINPNFNGYCFNKINVVVLNSLYIHEFNDTELEQLIFHELVHCHFKIIGHDDAETDKSEPASLMNSIMFDYRIYEKNRQKYINDIKKKVLTIK
jgi:predicted SprT family Zn-dependent metalloprotease